MNGRSLEELGAQLTDLLVAIAREAAPVASPAVEDDGAERDRHGWPFAMRIAQAVEYTGYSDDHLRTLANAGRVGHRVDGDPTSNAPWVFLRDELDRLLREDRREFGSRLDDLTAPKRGRHPRRHGTGAPA